MSVWNPENIRDVAEAVGLASLSDDVEQDLVRDVDFRVFQVLKEAVGSMTCSKRTTLRTSDISRALRTLDVEPLYGYDSTRPLRFGEAPITRGTLYYVEDEEVDLEKLINEPLPKVPREMSITAHWTAIEGVQPAIPQNPVQPNHHADLLSKGDTNPLATRDNVATKPLVKHVLSKEAQELFSKVSSALLDEANAEFRNAALVTLRTDPGIHQLVTYLLSFVAEKVTHNLKNLFVLTQMMHAVAALLENPTIYLDPYVGYMVAPVLTCCVGKHLGPARGAVGEANGPASSSPKAHYSLRDLAASVLNRIAGYTSTMALKARITRSCLKHFLDPTKTFGAHYGALKALIAITGVEGVTRLVAPNLVVYDVVLKEAVADEANGADAEMVIALIMESLDGVERSKNLNTVNGVEDLEASREKLVEKVGAVIAERILATGRASLARMVLEMDLSLD